MELFVKLWKITPHRLVADDNGIYTFEPAEDIYTQKPVSKGNLTNILKKEGAKEPFICVFEEHVKVLLVKVESDGFEVLESEPPKPRKTRQVKP